MEPCLQGLIDSIESAAKAKTASYSRSSSTPAMPTLSPISENPNKPVFTPSSPQPCKEQMTCAPSPLKVLYFFIFEHFRPGTVLYTVQVGTGLDTSIPSMY